MWNKKSGMTLVEVLIGLAVSSIIIAGSFYVTTQFSKQYQLSSDYIKVSQNARYALYLMKRDIRMAGYEDPESNYGNISSSFSIEDGGDTCCDKITLIYDKNKSTRVKLLYQVSDNELLKSEYQCEDDGSCSNIDENWKLIYEKETVSENVSNLQFLKHTKGGDALYFWSTDHGYDIHKIPVNTGLIESTWKIECCASGVDTQKGTGRSMTTDGINTFYFWIENKIYEVDISTGIQLTEWSVEITPRPGANIIYGDGHLYLWESSTIYKYNVKSKTKILEFNTEFSINGSNKSPRSGDGSGREIAYGNNELYLWWYYHEIAVFDTNSGSFKRYFRTDNVDKISQWQTSDGKSCQRSASMTYKDNNLYLIGSYLGGSGMYFAQLSKNGNRITNFRPRVCGDGGNCYKIENTCGDSHAIGNNNFYVWSNDEVYVYKLPFPGSNGNDISDTIFKNKIHIPCTAEYIPAGNCGGGGDISLRTLGFRSQQDGEGTRGRWSTNMVYIPAQINSANTNIQITIEMTKGYADNSNDIIESFDSSATIRNF